MELMTPIVLLILFTIQGFAILWIVLMKGTMRDTFEHDLNEPIRKLRKRKRLSTDFRKLLDDIALQESKLTDDERALHEELIVASAQGNLGRVKELIDKGVKVRYRDYEPMKAASRAGHNDVATYLINTMKQGSDR